MYGNVAPALNLSRFVRIAPGAYYSLGEGRRVERQGRLSAQQLTDLNVELAHLSKQQAGARETEIYVRMTPQETKDFYTRRHRISRIQVLLANHDAAH
jgi:hypothetical protein